MRKHLRFLSLWEMLAAYAHQFCILTAGLRDFAEEIQAWADHFDPSQKGIRRSPLAVEDELRIKLQDLRPTAQRMRLRSVIAQIDRIDMALSDSWDPRQVSDQVRELNARLKDELEYERYFHVPADLVQFYEGDFPFGEAVADRFPSAISDIENAGQCLALSQSTASVFHLMRVMEVGLKEFGRALGIPYAPSWESYIKQVNARMSEDHKLKTPEWKQTEPIFRDILGDIQTVKIAWRNPTMHIVRRYSLDESREIYVAVKGFMVGLATRLPPLETSTPLTVIPGGLS